MVLWSYHKKHVKLCTLSLRCPGHVDAALTPAVRISRSSYTMAHRARYGACHETNKLLHRVTPKEVVHASCRIFVKACQMCIFVTDKHAIAQVLYCSRYIVAAVRILEQQLQLIDALQYNVSTTVKLCFNVAHKQVHASSFMTLTTSISLPYPCTQNESDPAVCCSRWPKLTTPGSRAASFSCTCSCTPQPSHHTPTGTA